MEEIIYVKFISNEIGYGVYAKEFIKANSIIGEYTGVITDDSDDYTYCWTYKSDFKQYKNGLCIDSKYKGNILRFVNDLD